MEFTIQVTGMSCGHCVARVKAALESDSDIKVKEIDLQEGRVVITSSGEPDSQILSELLTEAGDYKLIT